MKCTVCRKQILNESYQIKINSDVVVCSKECLDYYNKTKNDIDFGEDIRDIINNQFDF
jgi:predicted nucleic acid-binding Zn ribbon protein